MAESELDRDQAKNILTYVYGAYKSILEAADDKNVSSKDLQELLNLNQAVRDKLLSIQEQKKS